jgi:PAS domain-containing protein
MSPGTLLPRESDGPCRVVADSLPLLVWISGSDKRCTYFNKPWLDFTGRFLESEIGTAGQRVYTPRICSIAWTRTLAPSRRRGDESSPGARVASMRERLKLIGGELLIESQLTCGTTVLARAPLPRS